MRSFLLSAVVFAAGCSFNVSGLSIGAVDADLATPADLAADLATPPALVPDAAPSDLSMGTSPDLPVVTGFRKAITIDNTKLDDKLTDFPVWIDFIDADLAAHAQANGRDIYFTGADGKTRLDYELQRWDAGEKHLSAWVRVPSLPANTPTVIYVYYGNPSVTVAPNPAGVFKSGFVAVWHLDDNLPANPIVDATGTRPGTPSLSGATTRVSAKLGSGLAFTGSNDSISFTNPLSGTQPHTISVWVSQAAVSHVSAILVLGTAATNQARWFYSHYQASAMAVGFYANDWPTMRNLNGVGFVLLHWVLEGNGRNHIYVNGTEITNSPNTLNGINTTGTTGIIGHAPEPAYGTNTGLEGTIDELRIANTTRSAAWIAAEYANQSSPGGFYSVGVEQPAP